MCQAKYLGNGCNNCRRPSQTEGLGCRLFRTEATPGISNISTIKTFIGEPCYDVTLQQVADHDFHRFWRKAFFSTSSSSSTLPASPSPSESRLSAVLPVTLRPHSPPEGKRDAGAGAVSWQECLFGKNTESPPKAPSPPPDTLLTGIDGIEIVGYALALFFGRRTQQPHQKKRRPSSLSRSRHRRPSRHHHGVRLQMTFLSLDDYRCRLVRHIPLLRPPRRTS